MKRVFITFAAGEEYEKLADVLKLAIDSFSQYKLIIYKPEDFDIELKPEEWKTSYVYIYKVLSCLKALGSYEEVVWLDNDCLPTKDIDKIWNFQVENYPLLPKERFNNFMVWPNTKPNYQDIEFLRAAKERIGVVETDFENSYHQACCMLFNKNCLDFFSEVLLHYQNFDSSVYPYGDESIINCMIWRGKYKKSLGDVFLCSVYFSPYIIESVLKAENSIDYQNLFDINYRLNETEDTYFLVHGWSLARHNRIGMIENNFGNLLFLHGSKSAEQHQIYLNYMLQK